MTGVYLSQPRDRIAATAALLRHFRAFLASNCKEMKDPGNLWGNTLTKAEAQRKLTWLVQVAINRKAGVPDESGRKQDPDYQTSLQRDAQRLRDIATRNLAVYQFETTEARSRFSHKLASREDF